MEGGTVLVWDLPTRLFHWLTVALMLAAYITWRIEWVNWHALVGEALLALVLFRIVWGFVGSDTARFARFLASPHAAIRHLARLFRREPDMQVGHNPAGGWMVILLLALLLGETLTGIVDNNDVADEGPLSHAAPPMVLNLITDLHSLLFDALLAAMALHVVVVAIYAVAKGQNLLRPMLTGRKQFPNQITPPRVKSLALAGVVLSGSAAVVATLVTFL
jgi:cytochrome b